MQRFTPFFVVLFVLFPIIHSSCVFNRSEVHGNYQVVSDTLEIEDYDAIELNVCADVIYRQISQAEPFLQISTDENILPALWVQVKGNRLIIDSKKDSVLRPSRLIIYTNSKNLKDICINGSSDICLENEVNTQEMNILINGAGDIKADSLFCERLNVKINGSGDIALAGAATSADFRVSGSGDILATNFLVQEMDCRISGSGDISIYVTRKLNASITGSGDIKYRGNPESINTSVNGSGEIQKINR